MKYLVLDATYFLRRSLISLLVDKTPVNMPPHSFIKKDAGPTKEWWKSRIIMLVDTMNEDGAKALFQEFHIEENS